MPTQLQEYRMHWQTNAETTLEETVNIDASILTIAEMEKQAILNTLRQLNGDKLTAARLLGIGKTTLYRKLKEYGISDESEI
jgi:two-component system response regulator HydG